ncbi:MAG: TDP-N-acetylfucosamine:lipid II N-acetylfucosaminyltransferase [Pseudomonadota bacterium]
MTSASIARNRIFHIFPDYPHHSVRMIQFLAKVDRSLGNSFFFVAARNDETQQKYAKLENCEIVFHSSTSAQLKRLARDPDAIFVFHSLFDLEQWQQLHELEIVERSVWVSWGADTYKHVGDVPADETLKQKIKRHWLLWLKRRTVKKLRAAVALNQGDADVMSDIFWARGHVRVMRYPLDDSTFGYADQVRPFRATDKRLCKVFCGNSADPTNHHIAMLDALAHLADSTEIIMPLNYGGGSDYVDKVITHGRHLFGDHFKPITDFMQKDDYDRLLAEMDVGVFFHDRQQGLYVAFTILLHGKPMYIRNHVSSYEEFQQLGMQVGDSDRVATMDIQAFAELPSSVAAKNAEIARQTFTEEPVMALWEDFLTEISTTN